MIFVIIPVMSLTIDEVEHIAKLARLNLSEEEKEKYSHQLSAILDYAARLQQAPTGGISPTSSVLPVRSVLRPDLKGTSLPVEKVLSNSPSVEQNQFLVPPVME